MAGKVQSSQTGKNALQVSAHDRVAGLLIAALFLAMFVVATMLIVWLSNEIWQPVPPIAVSILPAVVGGGTSPRGEREDFAEPTADETPAVENVDSSLTALFAAIETPDIAAQLTTGKVGSADGNNPGSNGPGKSGPLGDPRFGDATGERWEIGLNASTLENYAQQLDFFQIELGVAGGGSPDVTYISQLSSTKPLVRTGAPQAEKRLRFLHRSGVLRDADQQLARQAGVDPTGKVVFQFFPLATHAMLLQLEFAAKGERPLRDVRRTVFRVKQVAGQWEFFVLNQEYR